MSFTNHWIWVFLFALIFSFIKAWQLTLVMLAMVPIAVVITSIVNQFVKRVSKAEAEEFSHAGAVAEEAISSIRIVAAFAGEKTEIDRYDHFGVSHGLKNDMNLSFCRYNQCLTKARKIGIRGSFITAISQAISWMLIFFFAGILIWYAGVLVADGDIEPGAIAQVRGRELTDCSLQQS